MALVVPSHVTTGRVSGGVDVLLVLSGFLLVGNVRVYLDDAHVTSTYTRTVTPLLEPDLLRLTGW